MRNLITVVRNYADFQFLCCRIQSFNGLETHQMVLSVHNDRQRWSLQKVPKRQIAQKGTRNDLDCKRKLQARCYLLLQLFIITTGRSAEASQFFDQGKPQPALAAAASQLFKRCYKYSTAFHFRTRLPYIFQPSLLTKDLLCVNCR